MAWSSINERRPNVKTEYKIRRVEILQPSGAGYFKRGQYAYVIGETSQGGMSYCHEHCTDSERGEIAYLVSKSKNGRGGALWFAASALRFTKTRAS